MFNLVSTKGLVGLHNFFFHQSSIAKNNKRASELGHMRWIIAVEQERRSEMLHGLTTEVDK